MSVSRPISILFVDDDETGSAALRVGLCVEGFQVRHVKTAAEALQKASTRPDVVILDIHLPDRSGFEVCRRLRADPAMASALILHLSGHHVRSEDRAQGLDGGADGYLVKPVTPQELVANVKALLRVRQAEWELQASQLRLQNILDHAPVLVHVKDAQGRYLLVNREWEQSFHLDRSMVTSRTPHDVFPPAQADRLLANDRRVIQTGAPLKLEETLLQDGVLHTFLSVKFPLFGPDGSIQAIGGVATDITEQRKMMQALGDSEALYHSLVESLPMAIFRKDRGGHFTFGNQAFCAEVGMALKDLAGKTDADLYPAEQAEQSATEDLRIIVTGQAQNLLRVLEHPDGGKRYVEVLKSPVCDAAGQVVGMQGILWDVTAQQRAVVELGRSAAELRVARRIQQHLFPSAVPGGLTLRGGRAGIDFEIGGASYPAEAIGGDYYDYLALPDGSLAVAIADVAGHGIGPALLMAEARAYLRAFAQTHPRLDDILALVNHNIRQDIEDDGFITLVLGRLDLSTRTFEYASAGHTTGYLLDAQGKIKHELPSNAIPLGVLPEPEFQCSPRLALADGDLLLLLIDGVVESRSRSGDTFGEERAIELVLRHRHLAPRDIVARLYQAVCEFVDGLPQYDDITATIVKIGPAEGKAADLPPA